MILLSNFKRLHKGLRRGFIAGTFVVFVVFANITHKNQPDVVISSLLIYWVLVLLFSWVYDGFSNKKEESKEDRLKLTINYRSIVFTTLIVGFLFVVLMASVDYYNANKPKNPVDLGTNKIDTKDWIPTDNPFDYKPK